jgi:Fe-S cluster assembly iron-binding protein IscA
MLTLTDQAQQAVRGLTQDPQAPEGAGMRIAAGEKGLELSLVEAPTPGDDVIDDAGARVFVEAQTSPMLAEQTLDAQVQEGQVAFFLAQPGQPTA